MTQFLFENRPCFCVIDFSKFPQHLDSIDHSNIRVIEIAQASQCERGNEVHHSDSESGQSGTNNFGAEIIDNNGFQTPRHVQRLSKRCIL